MVIEDTALGSFADTSTMSYAVAAAKTIGVISIPRLPPLKPYSQRFIEVKVAEVCENLNLYASVTFSKNLCQKSGWLRSHVYKARSDWTGRAVVTSIPTPHYYNELHLPWGMAIEIFKYHIANKLRKNYDLTLTEETNLLEYAANNYHPIIGEIFDQLIAESVEIKHTFPDDIEFFQYRGLNDSQIKLLRLPTRGIPCTFQRNPTLGLGSMQPFLVTCIKRNIYDYTISFSDLAAPGFNADHDGDSGILVKLFVLVFTNIV
jgi:DNA-directed RNA polymerase beta' subunit